MKYDRADVLRILRITGHQLAQWQKAGLASSGEVFSFFDLLQLKKIRDLRAERVRPATIRASLDAMLKQVSGMENPLLEAGTFSTHSQVAFRHQGHSLEPTTGQFVMDFKPGGQAVVANLRAIRQTESARDYFARGVALEEDPASQSEAIQYYGKVLLLEPQHAPAHINLGTIFYNRREFGLAEQHYRAAIEADPRYALAHFDLGNVLDETGRITAAIESYKTALTLAPTYADAHYNLALAYEKCREPRRALHHWQSYVRLDRTGPWSVHALNQIRKILAADRLKLVYRK
jgi:tetratricopeptide (TPR) repeat protein